MSKAKFGILGNFDRANARDGQTVKTLELIDRLGEKCGKENLLLLDYSHIKSNKVLLLKEILKIFSSGEKIIIIANATSLYNLVRTCLLINKIYRRDIHFVLVGGALPQAVEKNPNLGKSLLGRLKKIYVETKTLIDGLKYYGLDNVVLLPNFKTIRLYKPEELPKSFEKPYKLVFMSRVTEIKGLEETIRELERINKDTVKYTLDIYGRIDDDYKETFERLKKSFPDYIQYKGIANAWNTSEIMHSYFLHLLPTTCPTEGQPASIIDSFFAGVPVLCGRWNSCYDMIEENKTGLSFKLGDFDEFREKLLHLYDHPEELEKIRVNCLKEAEKYSPEKAINQFIKWINE